MRVVVVSAVYNEEKNIGRLIESLLAQTRMPDEIVLVDDGSKDNTAKIIERYAKDHSVIRLIRNSNQGPAASRNVAWRAAQADRVIFTDGDCVPDHDWIEKLMFYFTSDDIAAVAGTYRTLNDERVLARFVGYEIAWRYRYVLGAIDAHGAYNLAIKKKVLEEMNGFDESYKAPSGEDWDLTYRISRKYRILFAPDAIVAHAHPEAFWPYMKNQARRGFDRIKLYNDHLDKRSGDVYTGRIVKYQVLAAGLLPFALSLLPFRGFRILPVILSIFLIGSVWNSFGFIFRRDPAAAFFGIGVQFVRCFAWAWGAMKGVCRFGYRLGR
ncbi:MAG: glycosyltransferase family A protein [Candidatus Omnitrophota bacterium]